MKKILLLLACTTAIAVLSADISAADTEPVIKIEQPAPQFEYTKKEPALKERAAETTKNTADKTKELTNKTVNAAKKTTDKTVSATKNAAKKTAEKTKEVTDKSLQATKDFKDKTVDSTKNLIDDINPNKPVTVKGLEKKAAIKTLKNERNELKAAYNSRIKDTNAKIKLTEKSTTLSDVKKQNKIYNLNKQKKELELQRDSAIEKYNKQISEYKNK